MQPLLRFALLTLTVAPLNNICWAQQQASLDPSLQAMQRLGPKGAGHRAAIDAWKQISGRPATDLPVILASMNDENPLANNWIRAAVDAIGERTLQGGQLLPVQALEAYLADTSHSPRSRRLAFEWIVQADPLARQRLVPKLIADPSLELRRDAVADRLAKAAAALKNGKTDTAIAMYRSSLDAARDVDQIDAATEKLRELGEEVNLPDHFGFIMNWNLIAPFDNTDQSGFDKVYPPEQTIDLDASYEGKEGSVNWVEHTTDDNFGMVDLNKALGKHKGAVAYAAAFFESDRARPVDLRLGCINANKIWLNGKQLTSNHVYHAGRGIDQYVASGELKQGRNLILLKICQNEQTESWAQDWEFQLRVCDHLGTAVLSQKRLAAE